MPEPTCPSCGFVLDPQHTFCPSCGARSTPEAASEEPEAGHEASRRRLQRAVGEQYRVGRLVGRGGFAEVFEANDVALGRKVAIKAVRPDLVVSERLLDRFQREARAIARLRHPNVMEVYTVGEVDGVAFFVMPLVNGESLAERIERVGPLPIEDARRTLIEAANALGAAHRSGTVHRDVKPDNILLEGESSRVLIADFGIAKALEEETTAITGSGTFVGTPSYMSPEQATGDPLDHRSDIYSLGVVAFQMITGEPPFRARSAQALIAKHLTEQPPPLGTIRRECPELLGRVVERCLAKDPGDRWQSLADMVDVLEGRNGSALVLATRAEGAAAVAEPPRDPILRAFRWQSGVAAAGVLAVAFADATLGLGGVSLWLAVATVAYLVARAARLWTAGYGWLELLRRPTGGFPEPLEDFGRFGSLVRACTGDRATIMKTFAEVPRQEQERFPELRETVEMLLTRVRHLARKVVTLEERLADAAGRSERSPGTDGDTGQTGSSRSRHAARLQELNGAREEAASELRACVSRIEAVRDTLTERFRLDASLATEELREGLGEAIEYLGDRSG